MKVKELIPNNSDIVNNYDNKTNKDSKNKKNKNSNLHFSQFVNIEDDEGETNPIHKTPKLISDEMLSDLINLQSHKYNKED